MATLDMRRNQVGPLRPVIVGMALDDPSWGDSVEVSEDLALATASVSNMDKCLLVSGYTAKQVSLMTTNDKVFNLRVAEAESRLSIDPDLLPDEPDPGQQGGGGEQQQQGQPAGLTGQEEEGEQESTTPAFF